MEDEIRDPKAVLEALERAKSDAKKYREELEELQTNYASLEQSKNELAQQLDEAQNNDQWQQRAKELMIKQSLGSNADRLYKFIDQSSINFDDDGKLTGIDEAIQKVKSELPELFDTKRAVGGAADLFATGEPPKKLSGSEAQVARLFRKQ